MAFLYVIKQTQSCVFAFRWCILLLFSHDLIFCPSSENKWRLCVGVYILKDSDAPVFFFYVENVNSYFHCYQWVHLFCFCLFYSSRKKNRHTLYFFFKIVVCHMTCTNKNNYYERRRNKKIKRNNYSSVSRLYWKVNISASGIDIHKDRLPSIACRFRSDTSGAKPTLIHSNVNAVIA
jgi:hypothetical protein